MIRLPQQIGSVPFDDLESEVDELVALVGWIGNNNVERAAKREMGMASVDHG